MSATLVPKNKVYLISLFTQLYLYRYILHYFFLGKCAHCEWTDRAWILARYSINLSAQKGLYMRNKFHTVPGILHLDRGQTDERTSRPTGSFGGCICADRFGRIIRPTCFIQQTTDRRRCRPKYSRCCCISYIVVSVVIALSITIFLAIAIPKYFWFKVNTDSCLRARHTVFPRICSP